MRFYCILRTHSWGPGCPKFKSHLLHFVGHPFKPRSSYENFIKAIIYDSFLTLGRRLKLYAEKIYTVWQCCISAGTTYLPHPYILVRALREASPCLLKCHSKEAQPITQQFLLWVRIRSKESLAHVTRDTGNAMVTRVSHPVVKPEPWHWGPEEDNDRHEGTHPAAGGTWRDVQKAKKDGSWKNTI